MQERIDFDGASYDGELDGERLDRQLDKVRSFLLASKGKYFTLETIRRELYLPPASVPAISARIRDLRKPKFGGYDVRSRRSAIPGLWEYGVMADE